MREYKNERIHIDGRNIPYPVSTAVEYLKLHDGIADVDTFTQENYELYTKINQIIALKQSCFLLRHTSYSCQSLSDDLYHLKLELIQMVKRDFGYSFDDEWMESADRVIEKGCRQYSSQDNREKIFDCIDEALNNEAFQILDGDADTIIVRDKKTLTDYQIHVVQTDL